MRHAIKLALDRQIDHFKKSFHQLEGLVFNDFLPISLLNNIIDHTPHVRASVYTPLVTLNAFIHQVLSDDSSCKRAVAGVLVDRLQAGETANCINTGPYCNARARLPLNQLVEASTSVGLSLHKNADSAWKWKKFNVVIVDGTTVSMPDTPANQEAFPQQSNQKAGLGFPIARLVAMISLAAGTVMGYDIAPYQGKGTGELSLIYKLLDNLAVNDLLLGDRYYCTYAIIALLQARGIPVLFQMHANKTADFNSGISLGAKDHKIDWIKPKRKPVWMTDQEYSVLPQQITVREFAVKGVQYVTTLDDHNTYSKQELAELYIERWNVEVDIRSIKTSMGMDILNCKSPDMVRKEIAVHILAYNIIRGNMVQAAYLNKIKPRNLSFRSAVQIVTQATKQFLTLAEEVLAKASLAILKAIASTPIKLKKRKSQPRAIKRRPKSFPLLTVPRKEACLSIVY